MKPATTPARSALFDARLLCLALALAGGCSSRQRPAHEGPRSRGDAPRAGEARAMPLVLPAESANVGPRERSIAPSASDRSFVARSVRAVEGGRFVLVVGDGRGTQVFDRSIGAVRDVLAALPLDEGVGEHRAAFFDAAARRVHARDLRTNAELCARTLAEQTVPVALALSTDETRCALLTRRTTPTFDTDESATSLTVYPARGPGEPVRAALPSFAAGVAHATDVYFASPTFGPTDPLVVRRVEGCTRCASAPRLEGTEQRFDPATLRALGEPTRANLLHAPADPSWHVASYQGRSEDAPRVPSELGLAPVRSAAVSDNEAWLALQSEGRLAVLSLEEPGRSAVVPNAVGSLALHVHRVFDDGSVAYESHDAERASLVRAGHDGAAQWSLAVGAREHARIAVSHSAPRYIACLAGPQAECRVGALGTASPSFASRECTSAMLWARDGSAVWCQSPTSRAWLDPANGRPVERPAALLPHIPAEHDRLDKSLSCGVRLVHAGAHVLFVDRAHRTAATVTQWSDGTPIVTAGPWWWGPEAAATHVALVGPDGRRASEREVREARDADQTWARLRHLSVGCLRGGA